MAKKLIFFDIDGTLYDTTKRVPASAKTAIQSLKDKGHEVAIATGRSPFMFADLREELDIDTYVSFNGSYVVARGEVVLAKKLQDQALASLHTEAAKRNQVMVFMDHKEAFTDIKNNPRIAQSLNELKIPYPPVSLEPRKGDIYQALLFTEEHESFPYENYKDFSFVRWHDLSVDVLPAGGSKARGVQKVADILQVDTRDTVAFGDALNDIEMLEFVGTGVAMGNGLDETKAAADMITTAVDENGINNGLRELGLIEDGPNVREN